jgi:single-stranded DNA-specific DHH superfamily exonuclease
MADEEAEQQELEAQMEAAVDAIREAVLRLLREGEVHPQIVVMAATRVAGGLGAAATLATGQEIEGVLGDLAKALRQAGRDHYETLRAELETLPVAGNA